MRSIFVGVVALALLAGCGDDVPNIEDPDRIVLRGKLMTQQEFLQTYCQKSPENANCQKVSKSMLAQSGTARGGVARN